MQQVEAIPPTGIAVWISNRDRVVVEESPFNFSMPPLNLSDTNSQSYTLLVKQVVFKNNLFNVVSSESDILSITVNTVTYTNIFEPGYYDINMLVSAIQAFLNTINPNILISYDIQEKRLAFTIPAAVTLTINGFSSITSSNTFQYQNATDRFLELIGFSENVNKPFTGPTITVADDPVNLYGTSFVDINFIGSSIPTIHTHQYRNLRTVVRVPITSKYGELEVFEPGVPITTTVELDSLDKIRIMVTDEWGNVCTAPRRTTFAMSILLVNNSF